MAETIIYTDGSCWPNPGGPGGFGAVLIHGEHRREISGGFHSTTNNRMEMMACIVALSLLSRPTKATLYSDSQYVVNGVLWLYKWARNGWRTGEGKPIKNLDLWLLIQNLLTTHDVELQWVRGHVGNPENEVCDKLAGDARRNPKYIDQGFQGK